MSGRRPPLLSVQGLAKSFDVRESLRERLRPGRGRALVALDDVSLEVARREKLGIVGESGSGKTTLARCLIRLVEPDAGSIDFRRHRRHRR